MVANPGTDAVGATKEAVQLPLRQALGDGSFGEGYFVRGFVKKTIVQCNRCGAVWSLPPSAARSTKDAPRILKHRCEVRTLDYYNEILRSRGQSTTSKRAIDEQEDL